MATPSDAQPHWLAMRGGSPAPHSHSEQLHVAGSGHPIFFTLNEANDHSNRHASFPIAAGEELALLAAVRFFQREKSGQLLWAVCNLWEHPGGNYNDIITSLQLLSGQICIQLNRRCWSRYTIEEAWAYVSALEINRESCSRKGTVQYLEDNQRI